jgi:NADH-quinone oxidoreductase subunit E
MSTPAPTANNASPATNGAPQRVLTEDMVAAIKAFFPRYPTRQAVTLPALHIVNERLRYVPLQAVVEVAELLELHPSQVQDTLTFYGMFKQDKPHGQTRAWVCRSMSCMLLGADQLLEHMCHAAGVKPGETTPDGATTIEYAECLGACELAPCVLANKTLHKCVTPEQADHLLKEWAVKPAT